LSFCDQTEKWKDDGRFPERKAKSVEDLLKRPGKPKMRAADLKEIVKRGIRRRQARGGRYYTPRPGGI